MGAIKRFNQLPDAACALRCALRSSSMASRTLRDEAGVAYVELAFILLPCILTIIFATFECSNLLYLKQGVTFIAKEGASYAFRECSPYEDPIARDACVLFVRDRMETFGRTALRPLADDMDVIVSVFEYAPGNVKTLAMSPSDAMKSSIPTAHGFKSKLQPKMAADAGLINMMQQQGRVAVAEVNLVYRPVFPPSLALLDFAEFDFYEVAIY